MTINTVQTWQLDWWTNTPGNSKYYGTNWAGTKWFYDLPTGGWAIWSWTRWSGGIISLVSKEIKGQYLNDSPWILIDNLNVALPWNYLAGWGASRLLPWVFSGATDMVWDDGTFMYVSSQIPSVNRLRQIPRAADYTVWGNWTLLYDAASVTWVTYNDIQFCGIWVNGYAVWYNDNAGTIYEIDNAWVIQSTNVSYPAWITNIIANPINATLINKSGSNPEKISTSTLASTSTTGIWRWVETSSNRPVNLMIIDDILYMQTRQSWNTYTFTDWVRAAHPVYKIV